MYSPEKKRKKRKTTATTKKKPKPTPQSTPYPSLPDDLLLNCLARVSRLYYPSLSLVSKSFRSLLSSPELYKARSLLGHTESCLYVCLWGRPEYRWFTLCRKPNQTLTNEKKKPTGYVLAAVPVPHSPRVCHSGLVAVGSNIYNIGGHRSILFQPSSSVSILDCRSHTWREAPSLSADLADLSASVLDDKIYVAGCCYKDGNSNSFEVFDTKTQIWDCKPIPYPETKGNFYGTSACIDRKFHAVAGAQVVAYNPKEDRWDLVARGMLKYMLLDSYCVIENVLYSVSHEREKVLCSASHERDNVHRAFVWYDTEVSMWRNLKGLVGLPKFPPRACVRLADYGGKMAVLWDEDLPSGGSFVSHRKMVCCAVIALERRKSCEIWGKVEWFDHVLTVPTSYDLVKVLAATV